MTAQIGSTSRKRGKSAERSIVIPVAKARKAIRNGNWSQSTLGSMP